MSAMPPPLHAQVPAASRPRWGDAPKRRARGEALLRAVVLSTSVWALSAGAAPGGSAGERGVSMDGSGLVARTASGGGEFWALSASAATGDPAGELGVSMDGSERVPRTELCVGELSEDLAGELPVRLQVSMHTSAIAYLSAARTVGGAGGGVAVRWGTGRGLFLDAELSYLGLVSNALATRVGVGFSPVFGGWAPSVQLEVLALWGSGIRFLDAGRPTPPSHPPITLGLAVAPLSFRAGGTRVSLLELGVGVGSDLPGLGLSYRLGLLAVGVEWR